MVVNHSRVRSPPNLTWYDSNMRDLRACKQTNKMWRRHPGGVPTPYNKYKRKSCTISSFVAPAVPRIWPALRRTCYVLNTQFVSLDRESSLLGQPIKEVWIPAGPGWTYRTCTAPGCQYIQGMLHAARTVVWPHNTCCSHRWHQACGRNHIKASQALLKTSKL